MDVGRDDAFVRGAAGFLVGAGDALLAEDGLSLLQIPTGLGQGVLAIHHARVGAVTEGLDDGGADFCHNNGNEGVK